MESKNNKALSIVFRLLSDEELTNATKVCRFWRILAVVEKKLRGPTYYVKVRKKKDYRETWYNDKKFMMDQIGNRQSLQIFFSNDRVATDFKEKCPCKFSLKKTYMISLESDFPRIGKMKENFLVSLFIPKTLKMKYYTYTFTCNNEKIQGMYCQELRFNFSKNETEVLYLKRVLAPHFGSDSCMLIFAETFEQLCLLNLLYNLSNWYPYSSTPIWAVETDCVNVCHYFCKFQCKYDANFVIVFINNPSMETYITILDDVSDNENEIRMTLDDLKSRIEFKEYSVALMHTPPSRLKHSQLERSIFKEIFPKMPLFSIFGEASFSANSPLELRPCIPKYRFSLACFITRIIIITYD